MRDELEKLLYARYPALYRQHDLPMSKTCMCWGFSCNDGWFGIIDALSKTITTLDPGIEAIQVKEKLASLHFYLNSKRSTTGHAGVRAAVNCAEMMSTRRCEVTGQIGEVMRTAEGWYATLSPEEASAMAKSDDFPRRYSPVGKSDFYWPPPEPSVADRQSYTKAKAAQVLYARHVVCLAGDCTLDFPPALFDLVDVALHEISCRPCRSEPARPLVVVDEVKWSAGSGLSISIKPESIRPVAEAIYRKNLDDKGAHGEPPSIETEINRLNEHCFGVQLFVRILSSKMDSTDGRVGPVDDAGNLTDA